MQTVKLTEHKQVKELGGGGPGKNRRKPELIWGWPHGNTWKCAGFHPVLFYTKDNEVFLKTQRLLMLYV